MAEAEMHMPINRTLSRVGTIRVAACVLLAACFLWPPAVRTAAIVTRGPYLQTGTPTSVIVRWRTDTATDSRVRYGTNPADLSSIRDNSLVTTEHEVAVTGLLPDTQYYYSIGTTTGILAGGSDFTFITAPIAGSTQPIRIWVIGDSGTADARPAAVRDAYASFTGPRYTDVWLMLGDNAYSNGTDAEYQAAVFNMYPTFLKQTVLWPTIGNHDTAGSTNPPAGLPYYQMFTLPRAAEAGGFASGTEDYYSFDYGNVHFVCLDSMTSDRSPSGAMMTWLQSDLASTTLNWIVAYWHHPPYSKGSHNSDTETELVQMRQNANPILESYGVDLVLTGHSHSYERSFLLDGHYGTSGTLTGGMIKDAGSGREDQPDGAYLKPSGGTAGHEGAVYAVAGSSGQTSGGSLNHPAMFISLNQLGSMVLDVNGNRLDAKFLRETGAVEDHFTIIKGPGTANTPPSVSITNPADGQSFTAPAQIAIAASASDPDPGGSITKVEFFQGVTKLGEDTTEPYELAWNNVPAGSYSLTAKATDNLGATSTSAAVTVNVTEPGGVPAAPTNLQAAEGKRRVTLRWSQSTSPDIVQNRIYRSTDGSSYALLSTISATTLYSDRAVTSGTTYYYVVTAVNGSGLEGPYSNAASAMPR
jgi:acid phosphatase type 7